MRIMAATLRKATMTPAIIKTGIDSGLSIGIFALCVWLVVTIVTRLCGTMDKLTNKMDLFTDRVREEHDRSNIAHGNLMRQHEGMIESLGRINGYKEN